MSLPSPRRFRRRPSAALLLLLAPACATAPPVEVRSEFAEVRAYTTEEAERARDELEWFFPRLRERIPDAREPELRVWVQPELDAGPFVSIQPSVQGLNVRPTHAGHEGQTTILVLEERSADTLGHEIVHALLGRSWSTLPGILEEGLCDWLALQTLPPGQERAYRSSFVNVALTLDAPFELWLPDHRGEGESRVLFRLRFQDSEPFELTETDVDALFAVHSKDLSKTELPYSSDFLYRFGLLLARDLDQRIGLHGMHRLCREAAEQDLEVVPKEWILAEAQLAEPLRLADLRAFAANAIDDEIVLSVARDHAEQLVFALARHHRFHRDLNLAEFLAAERPRIGFRGIGDGVPISASPSLLAALRELED